MSNGSEHEVVFSATSESYQYAIPANCMPNKRLAYNGIRSSLPGSYHAAVSYEEPADDTGVIRLAFQWYTPNDHRQEVDNFVRWQLKGYCKSIRVVSRQPTEKGN